MSTQSTLYVAPFAWLASRCAFVWPTTRSIWSRPPLARLPVFIGSEGGKYR